MNQSQLLVDQNNQYVVGTTPSALNNSASSSASSTPSSSCSSGRPQTIIANDFDFLECTNTINLVDKNSLMNLNMMEFHNLNQNGGQGSSGQAASADMVEEYWCANFNQQYMSQGSYGADGMGAGSNQVVMMPPPATMPSSSSTPSSSASSPTPSAPKRAASRSRKKPAPLDTCQELNAPKPPLTGYQHYFKERQSELRSQDASLKFADIVKKVGTDWSKNIDKETKNKFIIKGLQDKERYKHELKVYQSSVSEAGSPKTCKRASEPDECKLAHLHTPPPSNDSSSPASLSPHWLTDCCLLAHKDYFNVDAYHSKIIERSLLTQNEIKYLKQKLHQFKAEHKKLGQLFKSCKCDLDKKHGHVTELATTNTSLKSQLSLFKSLVHSCLLSPLSIYQNQSPTAANSAQYQMAYAPPAHPYHQYSNQSPPQHQQQQHYYLMDSASIYNQQIQLQLQQNQYPGQYYANSAYVQAQQQQQQQQQYAANGEVYQEGWMAGQARTAYDDAAQYGQYIQQQQVYQQQQQQSAPNQNSLQASTTS